VLVEPGESFGGLERFLDAPALTGHGDEGVQWYRAWTVTAQVGVFAGPVRIVRLSNLRRKAAERLYPRGA
jgi:hypothetical protein